MYRQAKDKIMSFFSVRKSLSIQVVKFIVSGGTAALVELILLYLFTEFLGIWYIYSLVLAFLVAFSMSFTLQKFWTFKDARKEIVPQQAILHLAVTVAGLLFNMVGLYMLVELFGFWYMLAQVLVGGTIAFLSFLIYKFVIFKKDEVVSDMEN